MKRQVSPDTIVSSSSQSMSSLYSSWFSSDTESTNQPIKLHIVVKSTNEIVSILQTNQSNYLYASNQLIKILF